MPQQSLLPEHPAMTSLRITVRSYPHTSFPDQVAVEVAVGNGGKDLKTVTSLGLQGVGCDFLDTLVQEAVSSYMYGETRKDVRRAVLDVYKASKAHEVTHQF